jgi:glutaredoxin-related protein
MDAKNIVILRNNLELVQIKAWSVMLYNAYSNLKTVDQFSMSFEELKEQLNYTNDKYLKKSVISLISCIIRWNEYKNDGKIINEYTPLLSYIRINGDIITYRYDESLRNKLNNARMYKKINMLIQNHFSSKHSRLFYGLALSSLDIKTQNGEITLTIDELRKYLNLRDDEYPLFKEVNRTILKKAIEEINDKSNLKIDIEYIKNGKNVVKIRLFIHLNPSNLLAFPGFDNPDKEIVKNEIQGNQELKSFLDKNNISVNIIDQRVSPVLEAGITAKDIGKYLLYIKSLNEKSRDSKSETFLNNLNQKKHIENFLQKLSGEKMKEQENYDAKLHILYKAYELVKVLKYLKERKELFYKLLDEHDSNVVYNTDNMVITMLKLAMDHDELMGSMTIAEKLLPDVRRMADYPFVSFDEWKITCSPNELLTKCETI